MTTPRRRRSKYSYPCKRYGAQVRVLTGTMWSYEREKLLLLPTTCFCSARKKPHVSIKFQYWWKATKKLFDLTASISYIDIVDATFEVISEALK